jgi:hypothetical protein
MSAAWRGAGFLPKSTIPYLVQSTDGPLESARISFPRGHCFNGPIQCLTWGKNQAQPARAHLDA